MLCSTIGGASRSSNSPVNDCGPPRLPSPPFGPAICAWRSRPAQNARPSPVSTMQRTSGSRSASSSRTEMSCSMIPEIVFIRSRGVERDRRDVVGDLVAAPRWSCDRSGGSGRLVVGVVVHAAETLVPGTTCQRGLHLPHLMSAGIPPAPQQGGEPTTMQKSRVMRVGVLLVALSFTAAACGSDDDASSDTDAPAASEAPAGTEAPAGHRGARRHRGTGRHRRPLRTPRLLTAPRRPPRKPSAATQPSDVVDGDLEGFAGTTPFGEITPEFIARLCEVDPNLDGPQLRHARPTTP